MIKTKCKNCGKEFEVWACRKDTAKYCSVKCKCLYERKQIEKKFERLKPKYCKCCNKRLRRNKWKLHWESLFCFKRRQFCNSSCFAIWYRGKNSPLYKDGICSDNPKEYHRNYEYLKKFGVSLENYNVMLEKQGGVCAICGEPETRRLKGKLISLAVDHNHETGQVRGLLCSKHNRGLGYFQDNTELLEKAIEYLNKHKLLL